MAEKFDERGLDSVDCANEIRFIASSECGLAINMTQTQKLLYIAYGIDLASEKKRLTKEHPKAWPMGPIFQHVHNELDFSKITTDPGDKIPNDVKEFLKEVTKKFVNVPVSRLTAWSCEAGSPWDKATKPPACSKWDTALSDDDVYEYFSKLAEGKENG